VGKIMNTLQKPDLVSVVEQYTALKKRGRYFWCLCPLPGHIENTPSFKIDPERQNFHCFGCNTSGDVITFIQKYKGVSFKEALQYLSISIGETYQQNPQELRRRQLINEFKQWCYDRHELLCSFYRNLQDAKDRVRAEEHLEKLAPFYHQENIWLYQIEILETKDEAAKFELYQEIVNGKV
jgi:DNA primase